MSEVSQGKLARYQALTISSTNGIVICSETCSALGVGPLIVPFGIKQGLVREVRFGYFLEGLPAVSEIDKVGLIYGLSFLGEISPKTIMQGRNVAIFKMPQALKGEVARVEGYCMPI